MVYTRRTFQAVIFMLTAMTLSSCADFSSTKNEASDTPSSRTGYINLAELNLKSGSHLIKPISGSPFRLQYRKNYEDELNLVLQITLDSNQFDLEISDEDYPRRFLACLFFEDHRFQFYSIHASMGVANVYHHYFIRKNDKFQYIGIFPILNYDEKLKLLVGYEKSGPSDSWATYCDPQTGNKVYPESEGE